MTFKRRLSLSIVALILALVTVLSFAYLRYLLGIEMQFALRQAETAAEQVRSATQETISRNMEDREFSNALVSDDPELPAILERTLGSSPLMAEIAVTDEKGQILSAAPSMERQWWIDGPALRELTERNFITQLRILYAPQRDYEVRRALAYENRLVLVVHVVVSTALLRDQLAPQIRGLAIWGFASLAASLVLAVAFSRIVFRPLDRLGEAVDRMTRGEFSAVPSEPRPKHDEYSAITSKLSVLGQQFRDAREGITSLRSNMEQLMRKLEGAVLLFDPDERLIIASSGTETFLERGRWQVMGQKIDEIFPPGSALGALVATAARLRQPIADRVVELPPAGDGAAGRPTRLLLSVELIDDFATRRRLGTMVTLRDAETRRQIETQVEISSRLAAISRLTGGVAHEIKNPLNAITLHLELLKSRLSKSQVQSPPELDVIVREMARLDRVVKTFLDFTRPVELRLSEVKLDALVEEVAALAAPEASQHSVRIHVGNGCPDAVVRADRDLLKQAVLNLAVNGIQAMPNGGDLKLLLERMGSEVELSVADEGVGIAPENRDKIFRLYFTTRQTGSGIGLAMTFRVVQLHNGTIDFSSELGRGTTFRVRIPVLEGR